MADLAQADLAEAMPALEEAMRVCYCIVLYCIVFSFIGRTIVVRMQ